MYQVMKFIIMLFYSQLNNISARKWSNKNVDNNDFIHSVLWIDSASPVYTSLNYIQPFLGAIFILHECLFKTD